MRQSRSTGRDRLTPARCGAALAAPATLNRLELSNNKTTRCHKLAHDPAAVEQCLLKMGVRGLPKHACEVVLDLDAMGHLVHGAQEGRHFSAYYDGYCYLPLYVFCGAVPLWAQLRTADQDGAAGTVPALEKIVAALRQRAPQARIIVRADAGFCRDEILAWCETQWQSITAWAGRKTPYYSNIWPQRWPTRGHGAARLCGARRQA